MSRFDWNINDIELPTSLLVIPTVDIVIFPKMVVPLLVVDKNIIKKLSSSENNIDTVVLVAAKSNHKHFNGKKISKDDLYQIGTVSKIIRNVSLPDDTVKIVVQGNFRIKLNDVVEKDGVLMGDCAPFEFKNQEENQAQQVEATVKDILAFMEEKQISKNSVLGSDFQFIVSQIQDPERLVDFIITNISLEMSTAQALLEKKSVSELLDSTKAFVRSFLEKSLVKEDVKTSARNSINKSQREYFLREQLRAIKKELGEHEEAEGDELKQRIEDVEMSQEALEEARRQFRRLEKMSSDSLEAVVIRNHLEWLVNMPWNKFVNNESIDLKKALTILNQDHFGLESVKEKILDYLSVNFFKSKYNSQILCLAGPPGVGKTSIGKSIAQALGRKFARISLGGVHDESELRGHRRTYVGALPGRFVQSIRKAGSCNPVLMIDEIDKIGNSGRGDPAAALLEILDPEQNNSFYDNYLGVSFDISNVMFLATCNDVSNIPGPLRDRLEIIQLSGYTSKEKISIAKNFILPKIINNMGLQNKGLDIDETVLNEVICNYTRESGVRELERVITKLCAKFARSIVEGGSGVTFDSENIEKYLGIHANRKNLLCRTSKIGVTNGLAWTAFGGEILQVEAVLMPGTGKLTLTGQLGEVMKESAQAAISYARSKAKQFNIEEAMFNSHDLHVHLPAGAIPKDGPSAGVTLLSSILSVFTNRPVNSEFAMTGELNLQGRILPIGGLKEKILAAQQHGFKSVLLPESNRKDVQDPGFLETLGNIELCFVECVEDLLDKVLL